MLAGIVKERLLDTEKGFVQDFDKLVVLMDRRETRECAWSVDNEQSTEISKAKAGSGQTQEPV